MIQLGKNINNVFPKFMKALILRLSERKNIQRILNGEDLYKSNIDSKWGRNTLNALAGFTVLKFKTPNLKTQKFQKILRVFFRDFSITKFDKFLDEKIDDALKSSLKCSTIQNFAMNKNYAKWQPIFLKLLEKK